MPMSYTDDSNQKTVIQAVNRQLERRGYQIIEPIRLSYQLFNENKLSYSSEVGYRNNTGYQGLTKVNFDNEDYMVKWQSVSVEVRQTTSLDTEITAIKRLQQASNHWPSRLLDYQLLAEDIITVNNQLCRFEGLVMPFFELGSLNSYLADHSLSAQSKLQLAINMAQSIQQLHQFGWVHGDIKLSNFLLSQTNSFNRQLNVENSFADKNSVIVKDSTKLVIYVNDLAYARPLRLAYPSTNNPSLHQQQNKAKIFGTPAYLAPECWHGQPITIQSDLYAFGITLYELFTERKPYSLPEQAQEVSSQQDLKNSSTAIMEQVSAKAWARLHCQQPIPLLPYQWRKLQPIIDKLLAKRVQNRYQRMDEAIKALQALKNCV